MCRKPQFRYIIRDLNRFPCHRLRFKIHSILSKICSSHNMIHSSCGCDGCSACAALDRFLPDHTHHTSPYHALPPSSSPPHFKSEIHRVFCTKSIQTTRGVPIYVKYRWWVFWFTSPDQFSNQKFIVDSSPNRFKPHAVRLFILNGGAECFYLPLWIKYQRQTHHSLATPIHRRSLATPIHSQTHVLCSCQTKTTTSNSSVFVCCYLVMEMTAPLGDAIVKEGKRWMLCTCAANEPKLMEFSKCMSIKGPWHLNQSMSDVEEFVSPKRGINIFSGRWSRSNFKSEIHRVFCTKSIQITRGAPIYVKLRCRVFLFTSPDQILNQKFIVDSPPNRFKPHTVRLFMLNGGAECFCLPLRQCFFLTGIFSGNPFLGFGKIPEIQDLMENLRSEDDISCIFWAWGAKNSGNSGNCLDFGYRFRKKFQIPGFEKSFKKHCSLDQF